MIEYLYVALLGLFMGSFLNVVADRLYLGETLMGRSKCEKCHHKLGWKDLIPIISYYLLKGKCRYCKAPISMQYPLAELLTSALYALTYYLSLRLNLSYPLIFLNIALTSVFIAMLLADLRYHIIPDETQIAFVLLAFLQNIYFFLDKNLEFLVFANNIGQAIVAGIITCLPLLLVYFITKERGMGLGDVKFSFGIGFFLGVWSGLTALYLSFILGGLVGAVILLAKKGKPKDMIAFGPFLIIGVYLMMFFELEVMLFISKIYGLN